MKKRIIAVVAGLSFIAAPAINAQSTGLIGFANYSDMGLQGTTGGMGGKIVHVTTREDFAKYCGSKDPYIIILDADLKGFYDYSANPKQKHDYISVGSNKTIIGGGAGARLDSLGLDINGCSNIIIRNLKFSKADPDAIAFRGSHHVWVDHCDLSSQKEERDENDGLLDFTNGSSYLTVSWCKFHDHDKTSICCSGTRNIADVGKQRVTYHHNSFVNTTQRNPRIGYGLGHIFNDYNETNTLYAIGFFARAIVNVENSYFKNCKEAFCQMYSADFGEDDCYWGFLKSSGNTFVSTTKSTVGNSDGFDVSRYYTYDFAMNPSEDMPGLLVNMGCKEGLEYDIIPFPGDGAIDVTAATRLRCSDIEGATGYSFSIGTSPDALEPYNPDTFTLAPGTEYYWKVRVDGGAHDGLTSGIFRFITAANTAHYPTPTDGYSKTELLEINESSLLAPMSLKWRQGFDAESYTVHIGTEQSLADAETATVNALSWQPASLRHGQTYFWRVDANRKDGTVARGDLWRFSVPVSHARIGRNEAEHGVRGALCFPEREAPGSWIVASNDTCTVGDEGPGYIAFVWDDINGRYDLTTAIFEEKGRSCPATIYVNGVKKDSWVVSNASANVMGKHLSKGIELNTGDELRLEFTAQNSMRCRIDYIEIAPAADGVSERPADSHAEKDTIYNLQGISLSAPAKGVNIINGKKVVVTN